MDTTELACRIAARVKYPRPLFAAADVIQEATLHILRLSRPGVYEADPASARGVPFETWLYVRALGDTRDAFKKEWRRYHNPRPGKVVGEPRFADDDTGILASCFTKEETPDYSYVRDAVAALPGKQRFVVTEVVLNGRRQEDVAAEMGVSQPAVSKLLSRATETLKVQLV